MISMLNDFIYELKPFFYLSQFVSISISDRRPSYDKRSRSRSTERRGSYSRRRSRSPQRRRH
jgi:hypothetical protein